MPGEATSKYHRPWPPAEEAAKPAPAPSAPPYDAAELRAALRSRGMRVTPQRLAVHNALHDIGRHSTAEEVLERVHGTVPGVSLPTVYAALELLTDLGLALRVHAGRAVRFDPRSQRAPPPRLHRVRRGGGPRRRRRARPRPRAGARAGRRDERRRGGRARPLRRLRRLDQRPRTGGGCSRRRPCCPSPRPARARGAPTPRPSSGRPQASSSSASVRCALARQIIRPVALADRDGRAGVREPAFGVALPCRQQRPRGVALDRPLGVAGRRQRLDPRDRRGRLVQAALREHRVRRCPRR